MRIVFAIQGMDGNGPGRLPDRLPGLARAMAVLFCAVICLSSSAAQAAQQAQTQPAKVQPAQAQPEKPAQSAALPAVPAPAASEQAKAFDDTTLIAAAEAKSHVRDSTLQPESLTSIFFTAWQHALLQEAKIGFNTSLTAGPGGHSGGEGGAGRAPGLREISLGGIAYYAPDKWTVWLNGVRVTPDALPSQILDIKVTQNYIDLKWFDAYTNKIYPVRLRPQERFNLDSRIFLPGTNEKQGAM